MLLEEGKSEFRLDNEYWIPSSQRPIQDFDNFSMTSAHNEFLDWIWRYGKPVKIEDGKIKARETIGNAPDIPDALNMVLKPNSDTSYSGVFVPIIVSYKLMGIICLGERQGSAYSQEDLDILETMSNQISIAIMNAKTSQELALSKGLESFHRLSAMLLHDLKSSASMLSLVIQNAADNMDNPEFQKDALSTMSNVANRIQKLIIRLSATPKEPEAQLDLRPSNMIEIIRNAVSRSGVRNIYRIKVVENLTPTSPVIADPENMERVVLNLLLNSIESIKDEGTITISASQSSNDYAEFSISDTGCGMSKHFINNNLFQPFKTTKERGLGIGLYQCKGIIEAMGGSIEVQSEEGAGSVFTVRLPIQVL